MRKTSIIFLTLLAAAIAAWAGDPWKQKAYKDWDDNDLRRILNDSPWAKRVSISSTSLANMPGGSPAAPVFDSGANSGMSRGVGGGGSPGTPPPPRSMVGAVGEEISFTVRWASAMTMRRAAMRASVRRGTMTETEAEQSLTAPGDDYAVAIIGPNLLVFQGLDEAALRKVSFLHPKKTKVKLIPSRVDIQRKADGKGIDVVLFQFAKREANGEAVIATDEKGIEFVSEPHGVTIRATFEPQKMVAQEGTDL